MDRPLTLLLRWAASACLLFFLPLAAHAASGTSLSLEQKNEEGIVGTWTLIRPDQMTESGSHAVREWLDLPPGRYTIFFEEPSGTQASVRLYRGTEMIQSMMRPQLNFFLAEGDSLRIVVHYPFIRTGGVAVHSDPPGLPFTMWGPNKMVEEGVTPMDFQHAAEGQYAVQFGALEGCPTPARQSDVLAKGSRISFSIILSCEAAKVLRQQEQEKDDKFVTTKLKGEELLFRDVPQDAWFAPHVFNMAKWGVISGYRDASGKLTGEFGPSRDITLAELLKIAHEAAGIDETAFTRMPENTRARNTWFQQYFASAEDAGWMAYLEPRLEPGRRASRAEVIATLLQAFDQPANWAKGDVFTDVTRRAPYAGMIETAAELGIVDGWELKGQTTFRPDEPINRAEIAKMVDKMIDVLRESEGEAAKEETEKN
jgi:hypothetical protein